MYFRNLVDLNLRNAGRHCKSLCARFSCQWLDNLLINLFVHVVYCYLSRLTVLVYYLGHWPSLFWRTKALSVHSQATCTFWLIEIDWNYKLLLSLIDEPRVDHRRGYNLRSGRHVEYDSPLVSRVPRSPARDANDIIAITEGIRAFTANCLPLPEEFEGPLGSRDSDHYVTRVPCQLPVRCIEMQNMSNTDGHCWVF